MRFWCSIHDLVRRAKDNCGIDLKVSTAAKKFIADNYSDPKMGARPLRRAVQTVMEDPLSDHILKGDFTSGDRVLIGESKGKITFTKQ